VFAKTVTNQLLLPSVLEAVILVFLKVKIGTVAGLRYYTQPLANGAHRPVFYIFLLYIPIAIGTVNCHLQVPLAQTGLL